MRKTKIENRILVTIYSLILLLFLSQGVLSVGFADTSDFNEGFKWGYSDGSTKGYEDFVKERDRDWEDVYDRIDRDDLLEEYGYDEEKYSIQRDFLRGYESGFEEGYEDAYADRSGLSKSEEELALEKGFADGRSFGEQIGALDGSFDQQKGLPSRWQRNYPPREELIDHYRLNLDSSDYRNAFLRGYLEAYETAYNGSYRQENQATIASESLRAAAAGQSMGALHGTFEGERDARWHETFDPDTAFRRFINNQDLNMRFQLYLHSNSYSEHFSRAFHSAFLMSYREGYLTFFEGQMSAQTQSEWIDRQGGQVSLETANGSRASLLVPAGTVFQSTHFQISVDPTWPEFVFHGYDEVSAVFELQVDGHRKALSFEEPVTLAFDVPASMTGAGIYQWNNHQWMYLPTRWEEGRLTTDLIAEETKNKRYTVLIDATYPVYGDILYNWAFDEIYAFLRRGYLPGGDFFHPEEPVTRKEVAQLIYEMAGRPEVMIQRGFTDADAFGEATTAVHYVANRGYLLGVSANAFGPDLHLSYDQATTVLSRMSGQTIAFAPYAETLFYEKFYRSEGLTDLSQPIKRSELIYIFYSLQRKGLVMGGS